MMVDQSQVARTCIPVDVVLSFSGVTFTFALSVSMPERDEKDQEGDDSSKQACSRSYWFARRRL